MDARLELDLSQSRIKIPEHFYQVRYDSACYPGAPGVEALSEVRIASKYAYQLVRARRMGASRISRFSGAVSRPDRELKFFGLSAQTSAKCLAGVLLTQFAT
jgi:hypothetical protein